MDKSYYVEWGLHLPFRFYNNRNKISEATDFGRYLNIPITEFLIMPHGVILPFQIVRPLAVGTAYELKFYCLSDGSEIDATGDWPSILNRFQTVTRGAYDHISFLGVDPSFETIDIPVGGYYATFSDGTNTYYSENIRVISEETFTETFRKWSNDDTDLRLSDDTTLRII